MPLPINTSLALIPPSADALNANSKPRHAWLVRLSSQTLDALDSRSSVQFQFGDNPSMYIGDTCYSMQHSQENSIHELYLRTSSATKKIAPLKLYANVEGKLIVERELADDLRDKIRESTQDAVNQRNNRTTVLLDTPPDLSTTVSKKRKEPPTSSSMFRKPLRPADKAKPVVPPPKVSAPSTSTKESLVPLRKRMVQCLAVSERTEEQVVKLVAGSDPTPSSRRDVLDMLEQIAEPKPSSDKSPKIYRLRNAAWLETRPYEWSGLSETERTSMARSARRALTSLGKPESDPAWDHFRYRSSASANPSTSSADDRLKKQDIVPKRGVSSRDAKEKKLKTKSDPKAEIQMKDESKPSQSRPETISKPNQTEKRHVGLVRATPSDTKRAEVTQNRRTTDFVDTPPIRRVPVPEIRSASSSSRRDEQPSPSLSSTKKQRIEERPSERLAVEEKSLTMERIKKIRRDAGGTASDSDRERLADRPKSTKDKTVAKKEPTDFVKKEPVDSSRGDVRGSVMPKRKAAHDYDDDDIRDTKASQQKRRKTEPVQPLLQRDREERVKDVKVKKERFDDDARPLPKSTNRSAPSTSSTIPSAKIKVQRDSPSPSLKRGSSSNTHGRYSPDSPISSNLNPSNQSHKSGSAKLRRRSPIYTSSDEEEPPSRPSAAKGKPSIPVTNNSGNDTRRVRDPVRGNEASSLPTDRAAMRERYSLSYIKYKEAHTLVTKQKAKLDSMRRSNDLRSNGSITESEGDTELVEIEELRRLSNNYKKLRAELQSIQLAIGRTPKSSDPEMFTA